jgi:hypothetical protein
LPGFSGKEVWITAAFDPVARKALEIVGWKIKEDFASKFLTEKKLPLLTIFFGAKS